MMPSWERAPFEVVEAELALQVFVHALGAPAFLEDIDDLLLAHGARKRREHELRGFCFAVGPFGDEPQRRTLVQIHAVVGDGLDAGEGEARAELRLAAVAPSHSAKWKP